MLMTMQTTKPKLGKLQTDEDDEARDEEKKECVLCVEAGKATGEATSDDMNDKASDDETTSEDENKSHDQKDETDEKSYLQSHSMPKPVTLRRSLVSECH